jgi:hypothetical protein
MAITGEEIANDALLRVEQLPDRSSLMEARPLLYRVGGVAAGVAAILTPISVGVFAASPPPAYDAGARVWFEHIQDDRLLGWMGLDLPFLLIAILMIPVMIALVAALLSVRPAQVILAAVLFGIAVATYLGTNTSAELVSLSSRYAEATNEVQRVSLLGAGEALLAAFTSTAFHVNYILGQTAGIILGFVMLRSASFGRPVAYLMIGGNLFGFLLYVPEIGIALSALSGLILWIWMVGVSRALLKLAHRPLAGLK